MRINKEKKGKRKTCVGFNDLSNVKQFLNWIIQEVGLLEWALEFFFLLALIDHPAYSKGYEFGSSNCCQSGSTVMLRHPPLHFHCLLMADLCEALLLYFPALGREGLSSEAILGSGRVVRWLPAWQALAPSLKVGDHTGLVA